MNETSLKKALAAIDSTSSLIHQLDQALHFCAHVERLHQCTEIPQSFSSFDDWEAYIIGTLQPATETFNEWALKNVGEQREQDLYRGLNEHWGNTSFVITIECVRTRYSFQARIENDLTVITNDLVFDVGKAVTFRHLFTVLFEAMPELNHMYSYPDYELSDILLYHMKLHSEADTTLFIHEKVDNYINDYRSLDSKARVRTGIKLLRLLIAERVTDDFHLILGRVIQDLDTIGSSDYLRACLYLAEGKSNENNSKALHYALKVQPSMRDYRKSLMLQLEIFCRIGDKLRLAHILDIIGRDNLTLMQTEYYRLLYILNAPDWLDGSLIFGDFTSHWITMETDDDPACLKFVLLLIDTLTDTSVTLRQLLLHEVALNPKLYFENINSTTATYDLLSKVYEKHAMLLNNLSQKNKLSLRNKNSLRDHNSNHVMRHLLIYYLSGIVDLLKISNTKYSAVRMIGHALSTMLNNLYTYFQNSMDDILNTSYIENIVYSRFLMFFKLQMYPDVLHSFQYFFSTKPHRVSREKYRSILNMTYISQQYLLCHESYVDFTEHPIHETTYSLLNEHYEEYCSDDSKSIEQETREVILLGYMPSKTTNAFRSILRLIRSHSSVQLQRFDAAPLSLGLMRILEMEFNRIIVAELYPRVKKDTKQFKGLDREKFPPGMSTEYYKLVKNFYRTRNRRLKEGSITLGGLWYLLNPDHVGHYYPEICDWLEDILTDSGRKAFESKELCDTLDQSFLEKYRNPPAHTGMLDYDTLMQCQEHVYSTLEKLYCWVKPEIIFRFKTY